MRTMVWRDLAPRDGWAQMAIDEGLAVHARETGQSIFRLYRWTSGTVSFGAHEATARAWDRERIESAGVPAVRRPTGGRAVWHDPAGLTYSLTRPAEGADDLRRTCRDLHARLAAALRSVGVDAELAPRPRRTPALDAGACFSAAVGDELVVGGTKVVGSAQRRWEGAILQHGEFAIVAQEAALSPFARRGDLGAPEARNLLPSAGALADAVSAQWALDGARDADAALEHVAAAAIARYGDRYRSPEWTWRR